VIQIGVERGKRIRVAVPLLPDEPPSGLMTIEGYALLPVSDGVLEPVLVATLDLTVVEFAR
jgi:hypothetical protein